MSCPQSRSRSGFRGRRGDPARRPARHAGQGQARPRRGPPAPRVGPPTAARSPAAVTARSTGRPADRHATAPSAWRSVARRGHGIGAHPPTRLSDERPGSSWHRSRRPRHAGRSRAGVPRGDRRRAPCAGARRSCAATGAPRRAAPHPRSHRSTGRVDTSSLARIRRCARTSRCFGPPSGRRPPSRVTSSGPSSWNCTERRYASLWGGRGVPSGAVGPVDGVSVAMSAVPRSRVLADSRVCRRRRSRQARGYGAGCRRP